MSMRARVRTDAIGNITVYMDGDLDFENGLPLRAQLELLKQENPSSTITLDMDGISFVGASGIGHFAETLQALNEQRDQIRLTNVKKEFLKVFKLYNFEAMEIIIDQFENDETEMMASMSSGKKKTFQN